jgi:hypothetical protein
MEVVAAGVVGVEEEEEEGEVVGVVVVVDAAVLLVEGLPSPNTRVLGISANIFAWISTLSSIINDS